MANMRLTKLQLEILHILWAADMPLSVWGIAEKSKYRIAGRLIVSIAVENLLAKEAIYWAGIVCSYADKGESVLIQYSANISFDEYYAEKFQNITPQNSFSLLEKMLQSGKLTPKQLRDLSALLNEKQNAGSAWSNPSRLVFTNELGGYLSAQTVYLHFKKLAAAIDCPDARFHDLRHSYAVTALRSGDDIKTVQENLGHHTAAFTLDVYAHVTAQMKTESANRMQSYISSIV